jgi:hypothetical protein
MTSSRQRSPIKTDLWGGGEPCVAAQPTVGADRRATSSLRPGLGGRRRRFSRKTDSGTMWSDRLMGREAQRTQLAMQSLASVHWAEPLLNRLDRAGGLKSENMPLMFEVRYADALHRAGISAEYEFRAGVADSTVEFQLETSPPWLIELVSVRTSDAARRAIRQTGMIYEQLISPTPDDLGRSEEGEMITAEQKIGEKVFAGDKPTKFPPLDGSLRLILTDIRGYLDHGGDIWDYRQMAYGFRGIPPDRSWMIHYWQSQQGRLEPIRGLFESENPLRAASYVQERIHFLGFICEEYFNDDEISERGYYLANWHLFSTEEEAKNAFATYPLARRVS